MKKILLITISLVNITLINAVFDESDKKIVRYGKAIGGIAGAAAGLAGGIALTETASTKAAKQEKKEAVRNIEKEFNKALQEYANALIRGGERKWDENILLKYMRSKKKNLEELLIKPKHRQWHPKIPQKLAELNNDIEKISTSTLEEFALLFAKYSTGKLRYLYDVVQKGTGPYQEVPYGSDIAIAVGIPAIPGGLIAGGVVGTKLGDWAAYTIIAKKRGVSKNIVKTAYATDVSLSTYKNLLQAAEKQEKDKVKLLLQQIYNRFFGEKGILKLVELMTRYQKIQFKPRYKPELSLEKVSQLYEKHKFYYHRDTNFKKQIGDEAFQKFVDAVSVSAAVNSLMQKKPYNEVPSLAQKVISSQNLINRLVFRV